jgi:hypothetical protein
MKKPAPPEHCAICGCLLNRKGKYAAPTLQGRSHATKHHFVAERFFGRSANRKGVIRSRLFEECPWELEGKHEVFCYECHEILLHNPVFTREDISAFAGLVRLRNLDEPEKTKSYEKLARRVQLLHEVIDCGIKTLTSNNPCKS